MFLIFRQFFQENRKKYTGKIYIENYFEMLQFFGVCCYLFNFFIIEICEILYYLYNFRLNQQSEIF